MNARLITLNVESQNQSCFREARLQLPQDDVGRGRQNEKYFFDFKLL